MYVSIGIQVCNDTIYREIKSSRSRSSPLTGWASAIPTVDLRTG